jgi:hypothetical protein
MMLSPVKIAHAKGKEDEVPLVSSGGTTTPKDLVTRVNNLAGLAVVDGVEVVQTALERAVKVIRDKLWKPKTLSMSLVYRR